MNIGNMFDTYKIRILDYLSENMALIRDIQNAFLAPQLIGYANTEFSDDIL